MRSFRGARGLSVLPVVALLIAVAAIFLTISPAQAGQGNTIGKPTITGVVQEGQTLTASLSGISDPDGLAADPDYTYWWMFEHPQWGWMGHADSDSLTYIPMPYDVGVRQKFRVAYTDGSNSREHVDSDPTIPVVSNDVPVGAPGPVTNIAVTHNGTNLSVSWTGSANATGYDVTYMSSDGVNARGAWGQTGTTLTITCDSRDTANPPTRDCVSNSKAYRVGVRAKNASGGSEWRNSAMTRPASWPDPVTNIQVTHNGSKLTVSWTAGARATHYDVTYWGNGVNARAAWNRAGTSITITCDSRDDATPNCVNSAYEYTVGVRARNSSGTSAWVNSAPARHSGG